MRLTVCELPHDPPALEESWAALRRHARHAGSELVLLPELSFVEPIWERDQFDAARFAAVVALSDSWLRRLPELDVPAVVGARPVLEDGRRFIEGFLWTPQTGAAELRRKCFLPEEPGCWEARWFDRGVPAFPSFRAGDLTFGIQICTELWALESFAGYAACGIHALLTPRATAATTLDKWLALGRVAAVRSGAYSLSSNRVDPMGACGGCGWILDPDGHLLATTSSDQPFVTRDLDLAAPETARSTYPRSVFLGASTPS